MMRFIGGATLMMLALLVGGQAMAADYKCSCYASAKQALEGGGQNIDCVDTYKSFSDSTSVQEKQVKVKVGNDNLVQGDNDVKIKYRPRDGQCLVELDDGNAGTVRWAGMYCNNSDYLAVSPFKIEQAGDNPPTWSATYKVKTTAKTYKGFLIFNKGSDDKKYMQAVCLENR